MPVGGHGFLNHFPERTNGIPFDGRYLKDRLTQIILHDCSSVSLVGNKETIIRTNSLYHPQEK